MNYAQILDRMPPAVSRQLLGQDWIKSAVAHGMEAREAFGNEEVLRKLRATLQSDEEKLLRLIVVRFGCRPFTSAELEKETADWAAALVKTALTGLRRRGLIAAFRKSWGDRLFLLPQDGLRGWQAVFLATAVMQSGTATERAVRGVSAAAITPSCGSFTSRETSRARDYRWTCFSCSIMRICTSCRLHSAELCTSATYRE